MNDKIKTPWYQQYQGIRAHLEYPDGSLYEMLVQAKDRHPDAVSYNYFGKKRTYREFVAQIDHCAAAMLAMGIKRSDRVSICMPNTPEAIISFYALNKLGAVANMIHPLSSPSEIKYYLQVSKSRYMIAIDLAFDKVEKIADDVGIKVCILVSVKDSMPLPMKLAYQLTRGRAVKTADVEYVIRWLEFMKQQCHDLADGTGGPSAARSAASDTAAILYSGGTTGYPKGIELTNLNFNALALQSIEACGCLNQGDLVLSIMPVFHGFGLGICIHTVQCFGGCCILLPQFDVKTFDRLLLKYKPNVIAGVPTFYEALLRNEGFRGKDLSFLKCVISGGDSLSVSLKKKLDAFLTEHGVSTQVREGYGLTECVTGSCLTPQNAYREGSIGIPYPDTYYKIVTPKTAEAVPYGTDGEILISGPTVMKGYLNDAEETDKVLKRHSDGMIWLRTGDLGAMDDNGFIYFKQRLKRMIVSSGYSLSPQYIENIIDAHPEVLVSCVIGIDDPYKGQVVKAFIVLKKDDVQPDYEYHTQILASIKAHCEEQLARYSWPKEYEIRTSLPKTLVGKIAYNQLAEEERKKRGELQTNSTAGTSRDISHQV